MGCHPWRSRRSSILQYCKLIITSHVLDATEPRGSKRLQKANRRPLATTPHRVYNRGFVDGGGSVLRSLADEGDRIR